MSQPPRRITGGYLTVSEVAERIEAHPKTVKRYCAEGRFVGAYRKVRGLGQWMIPEAEVDAWQAAGQDQERAEAT